MNTKFLLLAISVAALSSCSRAYKMGQTPDDVYFSPAKPQEEYVNVEKQDDRYVESYSRSPQRYSYEDYNSYRSDRMLRMSVGNRMRMSAFDDYYWNDGYSSSWNYGNYGYNTNWNTPWNSYYYWNSFYNPYNKYNYNYNPYSYNPYYGNVIVVGPKSSSGPVSRPRPFFTGGYTNTYNNNNLYLDRNAAKGSSANSNTNSGRYNNRNNSNGLRRVFSSPNDYYNSNSSSRSSDNQSYTPSRSSEAPSRVYTPSSSSSSSGSGSSSSGSSGGGVSRPTRGN